MESANCSGSAGSCKGGECKTDEQKKKPGEGQMGGSCSGSANA